MQKGCQGVAVVLEGCSHCQNVKAGVGHEEEHVTLSPVPLWDLLLVPPTSQSQMEASGQGSLCDTVFRGQAHRTRAG